jgi:uncharacterized protein (DUF1499 family)
VIWKIVVVLIVVFACASAYVRFAPAEMQKWHAPLDDPANSDSKTSSIRVVSGAGEQLADLFDIASGYPRTKIFAGTVDAGIVTFVTHTRFWGFPDYTTIWINGDDLVLFARLRFGTYDFGVNKSRITNWVSVLPSP